MKKDYLYLDYAAATPTDPDVVSAMEPFWIEQCGNPNALHTPGQEAKQAIEDARSVIAQAIEAKPEELIFTSGGTEGNSLVIRGLLDRVEDLSKVYLITTVIEHSSVLDEFRELERRGAAVDYIGVGRDGIVDMEQLIAALRPETFFVSVMSANNEMGVVQPIADIGKVLVQHAKKVGQPKALLHADACQVPLYVKLDVDALGVDFLTLDGQKLYGPKGTGVLYKRMDVTINPLFWGGNQERGLRPGTQNVPAIVGFGKAYELAEERRETESARLSELQHHCMEQIQSHFPDAIINGSRKHRLPNNINVSFPGVSAEFLVLQLDQKGIGCSTRSACLAGDVEGSYVIHAMDPEHAANALRITMGRTTTRDTIDTLISALRDLVGGNENG